MAFVQRLFNYRQTKTDIQLLTELPQGMMGKSPSGSLCGHGPAVLAASVIAATMYLANPATLG